MKMIYVVPNDIPMSVTHFLLLAAMPFFVSSPAWPADCSFPQPEQVIVYDEIDRGGACRLLDIGYYRDPASFRLPTDSISSIDVGANVRAVLYEHNEFRGRQAHFEGGFNYGELGRENDKTSSIEIFRKEGGAAATSYLNEYPSKRKTYWSEQAQGLANDGRRWFITNKDSIFKVRVSSDLNNLGPPIAAAGIPAQLRDMRYSYNHFGDLDHEAGFLFVPVEAGEEESWPQIAAFDAASLRLLSAFELSDSHDRSAPWLAIRPGTRSLWTSNSALADDNQLREYAIDWERLKTTGALVLTFLRQIELRDRQSRTLRLTSTQGGVFDPDGDLLYLTTGPCREHGYVYVFALDDATNTAKLQARSENGYGPLNFKTNPNTLFGRCSEDEGEGLDWLDARGIGIPGIPDGQLHLMMIDNDLYRDKVSLKHYAF